MYLTSRFKTILYFGMSSEAYKLNYSNYIPYKAFFLKRAVGENGKK